MAIIQANAAPITNKETLQTVTLKNIVALDVIENNEALLKAFNLLDDSKLKIDLEPDLTETKLKEAIKNLQDELPKDISEELRRYKTELSQGRIQDADAKLLESLSNEFLLNEGVPKDDTDELLKEFENKNNVKVLIENSEQNSFVPIDGAYLKAKFSDVRDKDNDVTMQ